MFLNIIQIIIFSFILILIIDNLYLFFKNSLTTPKIKDLVKKPNEKYLEFYKIINNSNNSNSELKKEKSIISPSAYNTSTDINTLSSNVSNENLQDMKKELKQFFTTLN